MDRFVRKYLSRDVGGTLARLNKLLISYSYFKPWLLCYFRVSSWTEALQVKISFNVVPFKPLNLVLIKWTFQAHRRQVITMHEITKNIYISPLSLGFLSVFVATETLYIEVCYLGSLLHTLHCNVRFCYNGRLFMSPFA